MLNTLLLPMNMIFRTFVDRLESCKSRLAIVVARKE
jgi:hypothetical protein